jgi:hypothetical protein
MVHRCVAAPASRRQQREIGTSIFLRSGLSLRVILCAFVLLVLTGCGVVPEAVVNPVDLQAVRLDRDTQLGQTFVAGTDGLVGIELFLRSADAGDGTLRVSLHSEPDTDIVLATASLPLGAIDEPGFYALRWNEPLASRQRDYYMRVVLEGDGAVDAGLASPHAYIQGSLYTNGEPGTGQLVHRLLFERASRMLSAFGRLLQWSGWGLVALFLFALPGIALIDLAGAGDEHDWAGWIGAGFGVGLALLAVLILWTGVLGLRMGPLYAWGPGTLAALWLVWRLRNWRPRLLLTPAAVREYAPDIVLSLVLLVLIGVRMLVIGPLDAPLWGDSVQHTVMTQLFLDHNGLFNSWEPYAPYESFTMQYGFSAAAAAFAWLTGVDVLQAVLITGQLLNVAAVLALYPLARRLADGNRWAGVFAVLVAGLLAPIPAFYVNWGRYAQLAGQVVLPVVLVLTWDLIEQERFDWRRALLLGVTVAGMGLCYYRMAFFYAVFLPILLIFFALPAWRRQSKAWLRGMGMLVLAGAVTAIVFLPWILRVTGSHLAGMMSLSVSSTSPLDYVRGDYLAWTTLTTHMPLALLVPAALGLLAALALRRWMVVGLGLWVLIMAVYPAGQLLRVPGAVMLQSFAVVIFFYIPVALLIGWGASRVLESLQRRSHLAVAAAAMLIAGLAGWGALQQSRMVQPVYVMLTRPDLDAMDWVREHTPEDAVFLVQGFRVYGGLTAVGADGGWWLPLLTERANSMPPQYALVNEAPDPPDYSQSVVELTATLETHRLDSPTALAELCRFGITHIYIGQGQGQVGFQVTQLFAPEELESGSVFRLRYRESRVLIYELDRSRCS